MYNSHDISKIVVANLCHSCGVCPAVCGSGAIHFGQSLKELMPHDPFIGRIHECQVGVASSMDIYKNSHWFPVLMNAGVWIL